MIGCRHAGFGSVPEAYRTGPSSFALRSVSHCAGVHLPPRNHRLQRPLFCPSSARYFPHSLPLIANPLVSATAESTPR